MALDAISDVSPRCIVQAGRCAVHGVSIDAEQPYQDRTAANESAEIRRLRGRIAELETALVRAQAQRGPDFVATPAVPDPTRAEEPVVDAVGSDTDANPAEAWVDTTATFEERLAARAFFGQSVGDEPARRWFLERT